MMRNSLVILTAVVVIALPFVFRKPPPERSWKPGDPVLVIVSPHNEAIRYEFDQGFVRWHLEHFQQPVKIEWRSIGGTTEISRYLTGEFTAAFRAWCQRQNRDWPSGATENVAARKYDPASHKQGLEAGEAVEALRKTLRSIDDSGQFTCGVDLFFGGGEYDHNKAYRQGLTVPPWPEGEEPSELFSRDGVDLIPARNSGEIWRTPSLYGTALSTFGICYNHDRLRDLEVESPPHRWEDLINPAYFRQLGVADPTKSGSIAKAFEMIVHQQCADAVHQAGFTEEQVEQFEAAFSAFKGKADELPEGVPAAYQEAVEQGWLRGVGLIRRIGANARYFTDSASKIPIDVSTGDAAVGLVIDFYGRFQAESSRAPDGSERMAYVTPEGGSSVSCDPISLLRGAPHRETAVRFITFVLSEEGQRLWNYRPGTPGGPEKFALRRPPILRTFYPSEIPWVQKQHENHLPNCSDALAAPEVNPYEIAKAFTYRPRWTSRHFGFHRSLIKAMCLDSGEELREAWGAILAAGGPGNVPDALDAFEAFPAGISWQGALTGEGQGRDELETMRLWTQFFRTQYQQARDIASLAAERNR